jgi:hypothetical protein
MSENLDDWLARVLPHQEVEDLRNVTVAVADQRSLDLANLLQAWKAHVEKLESDLSLPDADRSVWGAHDFIAALYLRDFVEAGIPDIPEGSSQSVERVIAESDERFRSYTEIDELGWVEHVDGRPDPSRGWWWRRIPIRGPTRKELILYSGIAGTTEP